MEFAFSKHKEMSGAMAGRVAENKEREAKLKDKRKLELKEYRAKLRQSEPAPGGGSGAPTR